MSPPTGAGHTASDVAQRRGRRRAQIHALPKMEYRAGYLPPLRRGTAQPVMLFMAGFLFCKTPNRAYTLSMSMDSLSWFVLGVVIGGAVFSFLTALVMVLMIRSGRIE